MNQALQHLKISNPELLQAFLMAIAKDFGISQSVTSFRCPHCHSSYEIVVAQNGKHTGKSRNRKTMGKIVKRKTMGGDINPMLIELARRKKTTTGTINTEFNVAMGAARLKNMNKKEFRARKIEWLKSQLVKNKKRA
jgi:hypothetical protein